MCSPSFPRHRLRIIKKILDKRMTALCISVSTDSCFPSGPTLNSFLRGSSHQPITDLCREFPRWRLRPRFDALGTLQAMTPGGLGKGRLADHRSVRQCRIFHINAARETTDARRRGLPHRSVTPSLPPSLYSPSFRVTFACTG